MLLSRTHTNQDAEDARRAMVGAEIIGPLLWCLKATDVDIEALNDVLRKIAPDGESSKTTLCATRS